MTKEEIALQIVLKIIEHASSGTLALKDAKMVAEAYKTILETIPDMSH